MNHLEIQTTVREEMLDITATLREAVSRSGWTNGAMMSSQPPPTVHGDANAPNPQNTGKGKAGKLTALVGVEDSKLAVFRH